MLARRREDESNQREAGQSPNPSSGRYFTVVLIIILIEMDGGTPVLVKELELPDEPSSREIGIHGDFAYIVTEPRTSDSPTMYAMSLSDYAIQWIRQFPKDSKLTSIVISTNLNQAFVADEWQREVHIVDLATTEIMGSLSIEDSAPHALAIDRRGTTLAVLSTQARALYLMDARSGRVHAKATNLLQGSRLVKFAHGGGRVFVGCNLLKGGLGMADLCDIPDYDQIVFASDRGSRPAQLYRIGLHDEKPIQITDNRVANDCPCWSPDGRKIAFISHENRPRIHVITRHGRDEIVFRDTNPASMKGSISRLIDWSPDGANIAFVQEDQTAIRIVDCQSKKVTTVFDAKTDRDDQRSRITNLCWAADGNLYFSYHDYADYRNSELFYLSPSSWELMGPFTDTPGDDVCDGLTITDDGRIAAILKRGMYGMNYALFLTDRDNNNPAHGTQLSPSWLSKGYYPQWFPDGRRLILSTDIDGRGRLLTIDTETGRIRQLTANGWIDAQSSEDLDRNTGNWSDSQPDVWSGMDIHP